MTRKDAKEHDKQEQVCVDRHTSRITANQLDAASAAGMDTRLYMRELLEHGTNQQAGRNWECSALYSPGEY
jgi:hypothetical protein